MDKTSFARLYSLTKKQIPLIFLLCAISFLVSVCSVKFSLASKNVVDAAVSQADIFSAIIPLIILLLVQLILNILYSFIFTVAHGKMLNNMRADFFKSVLRKDYYSISGFHSAELVNRITGDCSIVCESVFGIFPTVVSMLVTVVYGFIILYSLDKALAFFCVIAGPVIVLASALYRKKMKVLHKEARRYDGLLKSFMQECVRNLPIIKCFTAENKIGLHSDSIQTKLYGISIKRNILSVSATILLFIAMTSGYYIALAWSAYRLSLGLISFGTLVAVTNLVGQITEPFSSLSTLIPKFFSMAASFERLTELDSISEERTEIKTLPTVESVNIENICFSYDETSVLDNFCLSVNRGEMVALYGESGIGKSTLLHLITGILHPHSGRIYVKTAEGEFDLDETTRSNFAYVPQRSMLISGTVAQNICFMKDYDEKLMLRCAELACIGDFISALPDGFETLIGEDGEGLSGGQIQRLAIARALYYQADILLLDEATSAVDEETEQQILSNIKQLGLTCVVVTHRSSAADVCHKAFKID